MTSVGWFEFVITRLAILSAGVSVIFLAVGWYRREAIMRRQTDHATAPCLPRFELGRTPFSGGMLDVTAEVRAVLARLAPLAASGFVQLEMAVQPELAVRADQRALGQALGDLVTHAIRHAPCGRVLVGGMRHGGRVQISVTDDGAGPPEAEQEAALRDAERLIALQGGTIQVETHPREGGSTVLLRLPEPLPPIRAAAPVAARPAAEQDHHGSSAHASDVAGMVWGP
ncbi:MAG TPA: HAMP domain-containing sensor histidine kinase [Acetobacteraceae bacterium]|jgi:signal transduction histidine kinase